MKTLPTHPLVTRLTTLLRNERAAMADFLVALADFDRAKGWRELGYAGLFSFLHRELGLSKSAAFFRKTGAELVRGFPELVEPLRDGRHCITSVVELAKVLTPENRETVIPRFFHCSKQEAKAVLAELAPVPSPPVRTVVTPLTAVAAAAPQLWPAAEETSSQTVRPAVLATPRPKAEVLPLPPEPPRDQTVPLTAHLSRLHITVSREFLAKLEAARLALSHSAPGAAIEDVLEAGLDLVLSRDAKRKALVAKPRRAVRQDELASSNDTRAIPAEVRRTVWRRDRGECQWPVAAGGVCGSRLRLELDHVLPRGKGGPTSIENLRVLCGFHNELAARQEYGDELVDRHRHAQRQVVETCAVLHLPGTLQ